MELCDSFFFCRFLSMAHDIREVGDERLVSILRPRPYRLMWRRRIPSMALIEW